MTTRLVCLPTCRSQRTTLNGLELTLHTELSLYILGFIHAAHFILPSSTSCPSVPNKLIHLQYFNPVTRKYNKGTGDYYLVFYWIVLFTLLRDATMQYVLQPYAKYRGVKTYKGLVRFAEQAWLMIYYSIFWVLGMVRKAVILLCALEDCANIAGCQYINSTSQHWMNFRNMWTDWPLTETDGLFKWYYLVQLAFWLQQIFVLHIEERRKDHYQMLAHHLITSALITGSFQFHLMRVGNAILCAMDIVDILLPVGL